MSSARPHPPSAQRLAEARAAGYVPGAPLLGPAAALVGLIAGGCWLGSALVGELRELAVAPLEAAAAGHLGLALARVEASVRALVATLAWWLAAPLALTLVTTFVVQGASFGSPWRSPRTDGARAAPSRTAALLWCVGLASCVGFALTDSVDAPLAALPERARTCAPWALALTLACMVVDAAFARARFFASLWLTRREHTDARRAASLPDHVRAAHARARRALGGAP